MKSVFQVGALVAAFAIAAPVAAQVVQSETVFAAEYEETAQARGLYSDGDLLGALQAARPMADAGNPVAQNLVGAILTDTGFAGYAPQEGMAYGLRSAAAGLDRAWHNLGIVYIENHPGIAPNETLAALHFDVAVGMDYVPSMEELGYLLTYGEDAVLDYARARQVIERGLELAPNNAYLPGLLGDHYYFGFDTDVDLAQALALFQQGADGGNAYSQFSVAYQYYFGEGTEVDYPQAIAYFELAIEQDYVSAYGHLAEMLYEGYGVTPEYVRSLEVAERGVELGDPFSHVILGQHYEDGNGVAQDFARARDLYSQAYDQGQAAGLENLADMAYFGSGEAVDFAKSYQMYLQVLEAYPDRPYASYSVGYMLLRGEGIAPDPVGAVRYLEDAYLGGYDNAVAEMPVVYGHPDFAGPQSDPVRAMAFCFLADQSGYLDGPVYDETIAACELLEGSISIEQAEAAIALYQTL